VTDPQGAPTGVFVHPKIFPLAFLLLLFSPQLCVDGGPPTKVPWRKTFIGLAPGNHSLRCYVPYLVYRHLGDASIEVTVVAGSSGSYQWRSPWLVFLAGKWKQVV
jgi:hypothetical protein